MFPCLFINVAMNTKIHIFLYSLTLFHLLHPSHAANLQPNKPPPPLILSCGTSNGAKDADGRSWDPDAKYLLAGGDKSIMSKAETQDPSLSSDVPYMTARIFQSETTYQLPLHNSTSRTLLRLHFYPSSYPNFNISNSYFSVIAGDVTVLNNFSASLTSQALSQAYLIKEYYLAPSKFPFLNLTFKPSDYQPQSFAFVNGIEVISAPPVFDVDPLMAGTGGVGNDLESATTVPIDTTSMETMYRLNVGGQYISATNDSGGLMRTWYDDSLYIYGAAVGITPQAEIPIGYKTLPSYIAPLEVYTSSRSMGDTADINKNTNLTWIFQVDPSFMYLIRFHWCEFQMNKTNQRVFNVFINNKTASLDVDINAWANSNATPMKKDYVVVVTNKTKDTHLWVTLKPSVNVKPQYFDTLLNGLEIFKLSDNAKSNLAGPNPGISDMMKKYQEAHQLAPKSFESSNKSKTSTIVVTGAAGGVAAAFGLATAIFFVAYKKRKRVPGSDSSSSWLPISWTSNSKSSTMAKRQGSNGTNISTDAACNCRYFNLTEIRNATKNFEESNVIGVGGFGKVYKGIIDGDTKVAIKRSNPSSEQGVNEFQTEIEMLSQLRHKHLVSLIGFCEDNGEMILVYDYMGKGTLREHLYKGNKINLSWKQRLEICIGAARGLHYLHTGAKYTIIHRDVKTTNILVDDKWVAKVSDFGLSKMGPNMNKGHVSTVVKGSFGYLDPEYFRRQQLTEKSDVYSFGVVLFEVLCSRPALNSSLPKEQVSLADWALRCARNKTLEDIIDPHLKGKISPECLKKFTDTAEKCLADHGADRPTMGDVLWNLEFALQLQDSHESRHSVINSVNLDIIDEEVDHNSVMNMHRSTLSLGDGYDEAKKSKDDDDTAEDTFSQFVNQNGR